MEKLSSAIPSFGHINSKRIQNWIIEAIQLNEYIGIEDEKIIEECVAIAKLWDIRKLPLTKDHFLLSVDSKLRQKYASKIETETHHRGEKTQEIISVTKESTERFLNFDPEDIAKKYEEPWNNR
jgi:hypothetical protein